MLSIISGMGLIFYFNSCAGTKTKSEVKEVSSDGYHLVWNDEFEIDGLPDSTKWNYDHGDGCPHVCGWGNNELQYYTKKRLENARVSNGKLIIEAHKEKKGNKEFTSARLISRGKADWKYARIEVRAKLPSGRGTWPAIWMLSTDWNYGGWPESGEIDIMEHVGYQADSIFGTVHTKAYNHGINTHVGNSAFYPDAESSFKTYTIEWSADKIDWFVDDNHYFSFHNEHKTFNEWPFDQRFYLIMNLAVGGNWGGVEGVAEDIWPQKLEVDYVRIYEKKSTSE
ncbi:MAG: glycoside hydrolase family 16 protein [Saprospiraceae bacterium]|nr:glycoside hydrolase family 16 protein [Saprospiraceae bacterium]